MTIRFKLPWLGISEKDYNALPFGRMFEIARRINEWKLKAKVVHISQKRRSHASAIKEFKHLYKPVEYYYKNTEGFMYKDDSIEIFYTTENSDAR